MAFKIQVNYEAKIGWLTIHPQGSDQRDRIGLNYTEDKSNNYEGGDVKFTEPERETILALATVALQRTIQDKKNPQKPAAVVRKPLWLFWK